MKNMKPSLIGKAFANIFAKMLLSTVLLVVHVPQAAAKVTYYVGNCAGGTYFNTISDALAATPAPNVVEVCPGTYSEQILITKPVTLEGIFTSNADQAFITIPSGGLATNACSEAVGEAAQVCVNSAGTVNISNITVDGSGAVGPAGITYNNSSGTLNHIETRFQEGENLGLGIALQGAANTVTVENSNLHNFDGSGISTFDSSPSQGEFTVKIEGNTLVPDATAQNGIWVEGGKSVTISGNLIDGPATPPCTSDQSGCAGITINSSHAGSISKNTVFGLGTNGDGIFILASALSVTFNTIFDVGASGIVLASAADVTGLTIENNTITQAQNGIDFGCESGNTVTSNTMTAIHSDGLANVPSGSIPVNYYYNVPTLYSTCP